MKKGGLSLTNLTNVESDLPSPFKITNNFVATSGEDKFYHPTQKPLGA